MNKKMKKEQLAKLLNGNEYRNEITKEQEQIAKENNLLVLFGASDDLLEMRGALDDEVEAWDGGYFALKFEGELYLDYDDEETCHKSKGLEIVPLKYHRDDDPRLIRVIWMPDNEYPLSWCISSNMPCVPFTIIENREPYCEGIVIDLNEIKCRKP